MSIDAHVQAIMKAQAAIDSGRKRAQNAAMRQRYHLMPQTGWMNDPNGLIFFRGQYHFFYQHNPYEAIWGAMHWGHAVSDDLVHWHHLPVALAPSEPYDNHPKGGCFSGSAIEHEGMLYLMYTGVANNGRGMEQTQCLAYSLDGIHFEKHPGNPVVTAPPGYRAANFRDPKVWRHEGMFYMVAGAEKNGAGCALLFRSPNLTAWTFVNILAESRGELGRMWECPDFFALGEKHVLMISPVGAGWRKTVYLTGDMDYARGKFVHTAMGEIDWGFDYYAPQSFVDGQNRRILAGWANGWEFMPWWRDWGPTYREGWCGSLSLPREARLMPGGTLQFVPVEELRCLRSGHEARSGWRIEGRQPLPAGDGVAFELMLLFDLSKTTARQINLYLRCAGERQVKVTLDLSVAEILLDRGNADGWSQGVARCPLPLAKRGALDVHVFSDQSSIELSAADYTVAMSANVFSVAPQQGAFIEALDGDAFCISCDAWGMERAVE